MNFIGNIIWLIFGGLFIAIEYFISSLILFLTIKGIPFGLQTLKLAGLALWPFGRETRVIESSNDGLSITMNIIWFFVGGIWIFLSHFALGIIFAISMIGFPWARQHFKMAKLALKPFGREIVEGGGISKMV